MAANVETMMYVREVPWHNLGTSVREAPNSEEALRLAGLDWQVLQEPMYTAGGMVIPNYKANIRDTDRKVLGVVTDAYRVVQNKEAFAFTDNLIGGDVRYETAGSLREGKKIWLLARMPETSLVGDKTEPYMCFSNTHDGSGAVRVCMTPVRVVCQNTLNLAFRGANRAWSVRHTGSIQDKLHEAEKCLELGCKYMEGLSVYADKLANTKLMRDDVRKILDELFPVDEAKTSPREKANIQKVKEEYMVCYFAPDLVKFRDTAWGALNAMSDMVTHNAPRRMTKNYWANNWDRVMNGHVLMDRMTQMIGVK